MMPDLNVTGIMVFAVIGLVSAFAGLIWLAFWLYEHLAWVGL